MAEYAKLNLKATTVTGAVMGLLCGLLPFGMMGSYSSYMMGYASVGWIAPVYGLVAGAIGGVLVSLIYNWALSMK